MSLDANVKHSGKAGAHIKFIGESAEGFGTLTQVFKAGAYHGKRVRMSAWMKTENADSAQLWMRLDGEKRMLGFDNMDNRPVKGTTKWKKYEITLDVPEATVNIAFGAFVVGKGQAWVDDFQFEVVGQEIATTNMLTPEDMQEEHSFGMIINYPPQPMNLNFEEGAEPERQVVKVDQKILETYVGEYQYPGGRVFTVTREGNKLNFTSPDFPKSEVLPQSETEFFENGTSRFYIFVKNARGEVTHFIRPNYGADTIVKKIK